MPFVKIMATFKVALTIIAMKNILYLSLITCLYFSCRSYHKLTTRDDTSTTIAFSQSQKLIEKFKPVIQGVWVKSDYIDKVIKTKSPLAAADKANGITTMYINTEKINGDSLSVDIGTGNHEGSEMILKFKPGKNKKTISFGYSDLGYEINNGDTILVLYYFGKDKYFDPITKYSKVLNKQSNDDLGYGMNYIINKGLISGNYILHDSVGNYSAVNFSDNGTVTGFFNYTKFNFNIDLHSDIRDNLDEIGFDYDTKNNVSYSYKINNDTLNLYTTKVNITDTDELIIDKLKYKLVRQK
jgi:hypothetical protein